MFLLPSHFIYALMFLLPSPFFVIGSHMQIFMKSISDNFVHEILGCYYKQHVQYLAASIHEDMVWIVMHMIPIHN